MSWKPQIPHFGNDLPYTTAKEDRKEALKREMEKLYPGSVWSFTLAGDLEDAPPKPTKITTEGFRHG